MKHKWLRYLFILLLVPFFLLGITVALIYLPPIQHWLKREVIAYVADTTPFQLSVDKFTLSFPADLRIKGVMLTKSDKLLLHCDNFKGDVSLLPLLKGQLKVNHTAFKNLTVNSDSLFPNYFLKGKLEALVLGSQVIDFYHHSYRIDKVTLDGLKGEYQLLKNEEKRPTSSPFDWNLKFADVAFSNLSLKVIDKNSSAAFSADIKSFNLTDLNIIPFEHNYSFDKFVVDKTSFDLLHQQESIFTKIFGVEKLSLKVNSFNLDKNRFAFQMSRGEGLLSTGHQITELTGRLNTFPQSNDTSYLQLKTPFSALTFNAKGVDFSTDKNESQFSYDLLLGKEDIAKLFSDSLFADIPFHHLMAHGLIQGDKKRMQLIKSEVTDNCGTSLTLKGEAENWLDASNRVIALESNFKANSDSIWALLVSRLSNHRVTFPDTLHLHSSLLLEKENLHVSATMKASNQGGLMVNATSNLKRQSYEGKLKLDSLNLLTFMPQDSIGTVDADFSFAGEGFNIKESSSALDFQGTVNALAYSKSRFSNVHLFATIKNRVLESALTANSDSLKMNASLTYHLYSSHPVGNLSITIDKLRPDAFHFIPPIFTDSTTLHCSSIFDADKFEGELTSNHLSCIFHSDDGVVRWQKFFSTLPSHISVRALSDSLNHRLLTKQLPSLELRFSAYQDNLLSTYLRTMGLHMDSLSWHVSSKTSTSLTSDLLINDLRYKEYSLNHLGCSLQHDTLSSLITFRADKKDKLVEQNFSASASMNIGAHSSELALEYLDGNGNVGLSLGALITPYYSQKEKSYGLHIDFQPSNPILGFTKYQFLEGRNTLDYTFNKRLSANIDLVDDKGRGIYFHSLPADSLWSDVIEAKVEGIELADFSKTLVNRPPFSGILAANILFKRRDKKVKLGGELSIDNFVYNHTPLGHLLMDLKWSPEDEQRQSISASLFKDNQKVLFADGLFMMKDNLDDQMNLSLKLNHFPLSIANLFIHRDDLSVCGCLDGALTFTQQFTSPQIDGELLLDSVSLISNRLGAAFKMEQRPILFKGSRVNFENFSIYTNGDNPFLVNGTVDLSHLLKPNLDLKLKAKDYLLIDAKRSAKSLLYGKVLVDVDSSVKGSIENLKVRGEIAVLGETDLSCVVLNSPLTVKDRLASLVDFKSFDEESQAPKKVIPQLSLGGLDVLMTLKIDPSVRLKVDLSSNAKNYIKLEGGGDLAMRYNPYGNFSMTGRYRFTGGVMRYSLPVIPLKEFNIDEGSYIDWTGEVDNPNLHFKATEKLHVTVSDQDGNSRMVNFEVSIIIKNGLKNMFLAFDLSAPQDNGIQNELAMMGDEERGKQAVALMITGKYLGSGLTKGTNNGLNLDMGSALNMVLGSQINALLENLKDAELTFGVDQYVNQEAGGRNVDYKFRYSQRLFNDRVQIIIGGKVSTGEKNSEENDHFIDNISLEYRLDRSGSRYIRLFYHNDYESLLQEDITEGGIGIVLRKKMNNLGELFIFKKKKK